MYTLTIVRLVSPDNSPSFGRVEIQFYGTWGTICDNDWDLKDADVVCRQLGYDGALSALRHGAFGKGTGPIWLDRVQCGGSEESVSQCAHARWEGHSCSHHNDASVVCHQIKGKFNDTRSYLNNLNSYYSMVGILKIFEKYFRWEELQTQHFFHLNVINIYII